MNKLMRADTYVGIKTDKTFTTHGSTVQFEEESTDEWIGRCLSDYMTLLEELVSDEDTEEDEE